MAGSLKTQESTKHRYFLLWQWCKLKYCTITTEVVGETLNSGAVSTLFCLRVAFHLLLAIDFEWP